MNLEQLLYQAQAYDREQAILNVMKTLYSMLDISEVFHMLVNELGQLLLADQCIVWRLNGQAGETSAWEFRARPDIPSLMEPTVASVESAYALVVDCVAQKASVLTYDESDDFLSLQARELLVRMNIKAGICYQLHEQGRPIAIIMAHHVDTSWEWSDHEKQTFHIFGHYASLALRQNRLFRQLPHPLRREEALHEIQNYVAKGFGLLTLMDKTAGLLAHSLDIPVCHVLEQLPGMELMQIQSIHGWDATSLVSALIDMPTRPDLRAIFQTDKPYQLIQSQLRFLSKTLHLPDNIRTGLIVPIIGLNKTRLGIIGLYSNRQRIFSVEESDFVTQISRILTMAIERDYLGHNRSGFDVSPHAAEGAFPYGIWEWRAKNNHTYWNDELYNILGLTATRNGPIGDEFRALCHPDDVEAVEDAVVKHLFHNERYEVMFRMRHRSGDYRYCLSRAKALRTPYGKPICFTGTITDISQRFMNG